MLRVVINTKALIESENKRHTNRGGKSHGKAEGQNGENALELHGIEPGGGMRDCNEKVTPVQSRKSSGILRCEKNGDDGLCLCQIARIFICFKC